MYTLIYINGYLPSCRPADRAYHVQRLVNTFICMDMQMGWQVSWRQVARHQVCIDLNMWLPAAIHWPASHPEYTYRAYHLLGLVYPLICIDIQIG